MSIDERVSRLEANESIRRLKHAYCYRLDDRDWEGFLQLFTDDATLDYGGLGTYEGREGVREFAEEFVAEHLEATAHAVHNGVIDVGSGGADGADDTGVAGEDTATGRWYVTSFITLPDRTSGFRMGNYDERYRRVDDAWKITSLRLRFLYSADYDVGWPDLETHDRPDR